MGITCFTPAPLIQDEGRREHAVAASGALDAVDDPLLRQLVEDTRALLGTSMAAVSIIYQDWQYLIAASGLDEGVYSRRTSFCGHTIAASDGILCVPDARADDRFAGNPAVLEGIGVRFYVGVPLLDEQGLPLGALCAFDPAPRDGVTPAQESALRQVAEAVIARLDTLRLATP